MTRILEIRRSQNAAGSLPAHLIDYLTDASPAVAGEALRAIFALEPLAAMPERWPEGENRAQRIDSTRLPWMTEPPWEWDRFEALVDRCIQTLCNSSGADRQRVSERLALLPGLRGRIANRLRDHHQAGLLNLFQGKVDQWRAAQFPRQLTIAPTLNCQLACQFCISAGSPTKNRSEMSMEMIRRLLDWAQKDRIERVGLTGGEPTLYRHFADLIRLLGERGFSYYLATNGIFPDQTADIIIQSKPLCVTMHLTASVLMSDQSAIYARNAAALVESGVYVILRCNFFEPSENPARYVDAAVRSGIREIRASIPMPNAGRHNRYVEVEDLAAYGDLLARFVEEGRHQGVETRLAKPFFPCKLPAETARTFIANGSMGVNCPVHENNCSNNLIVHPDGTFSPCLGLSLNSKRKIFEFDSCETAAGLFEPVIQSLSRIPILEDCRDCALWVGGRCIGACLSYRLPDRGTEKPAREREP